jgi:hypothetical protein
MLVDKVVKWQSLRSALPRTAGCRKGYCEGAGEEEKGPKITKKDVRLWKEKLLNRPKERK